MKPLLLLVTLCFSFDLLAQKYLPANGKQLLIIGQDLESVNKYVTSGKFPVPGGHTVYLGFFNITNANAGFGGLGEDLDGNPVADADWGAGPVNAHKAAFDDAYKHTALVIGLSLEDHTKEKFKGLGEGKFDAEIDRLGRFIKSLDKPVYLRIGYEFDGKWNVPYNNTSEYKAAFRRITIRMRQQGVDNFATVWQASTSPIDDIMDGVHENIADWYPDDDVVDWMGLSWFLHPGFSSPVSSVQITQGQLAAELLALARQHNKPVMIAESAPCTYDLEKLTKRNFSAILDGPAGQGLLHKTPRQIWLEWYQPYFDFIETNKDVIRAVAYINANWDQQRMWGEPYSGGYWGNTQLQENKYICKKWNRQVRKTNWLHGGVSLFRQLH